MIRERPEEGGAEEVREARGEATSAKKGKKPEVEPTRAQSLSREKEGD